jgi:raffinose/stachyose/melibiose transport system permease protein
MLLNRSFKGRVVFRGIFYFPYVLSGVIVGIIWSWIYQPQLGLITNMMNFLHLGNYSKAFLADTKTAFYAVYLAGLWQGIGAPMILFLSGLQTVPNDLYEAAAIDGAGKFRTFFSITIPMLRETFVIVFALQVISAVKVYDIIYAMTGGGPAQSTQVMATWMVTQSFRFSNIGQGTAIACIMLLVLMIVIIPFVLFMARE